MPRFWCISCQTEVEHRADYCHSRCGNDCEAVCVRCNRRTLTTDVKNPHDTDAAAIRWATGEAQRQARTTGRTGSIEVVVSRVDTNGIIYDRTAVYDTSTMAINFVN